mmetsp:Transcript_91865/g.126655  ORF Transcript_91865/g.126655 Transcript_91865/m.126655 type:complete len:104 (+) Transcript_91865:25-336(+)|eukprot:CAMPEP_0176385890 /NCGR_PEP_ID=MMETSP0126-20121128/35500_1 /TAXON_ID=141414 ORGANISM="Strombidinopsis acuminatum, Strain SPMC142" /NCGR_SAMPLE_ID=MMETSP0126 /ASSEMBLY_ACC=CAM_ASM_000229 /LENGTH=103 /DNA_ID=CAMNT_0017752499 /DNA_START=23 /DNA_END=334 /DNA_ORIENTATION=+
MAEVEERIARIKNAQGVRGLLITDDNGKLLRQSFTSTDHQVYASQLGKQITELAKKARSVVRDIDATNDLTFFRVRSKKQEILVAPDNSLFLIVIQNTETEEQ